jgi:hypothetical protein
MALSLLQAQKMLEKKDTPGITAVRRLAGMASPICCIKTDSDTDVVVFGTFDSDSMPIGIDDFVVALRAVLKYGQAPLVSIDPAKINSSEQPVRFEGKLEDTRFGNELLDADVVLKKLGLGKLKADVWGIKSYFDLSVDEWCRSGKEDAALNRFWFLTDPEGSSVAVRKDIGLVKRLKIKVQTETMGRPGIATDPVGDAFAASMTSALGDLMVTMPELRRLDQLYRLVGIASIIQRWRDKFGVDPDSIGMNYWLNDYPVERVSTPPTYALMASTAKDATGKKTMTISGGVELRALVEEVKGGSLSALRDLVLKSRPSADAVSWNVPVGDALNEITDVESGEAVATQKETENAGTFFRTQYGEASVHGSSRPLTVSENIAWQSAKAVVASVNPSSMGFSDFAGAFRDARAPSRSPGVGGVMLSGIGAAADGKGARVGLEGGNFSLVVGGENAQLDPRMFRKFVTALWSVYFGRTDPGLSIDPIYQDSKTGNFSPKHMVRYIGRVVNTDLGRVMRETDYIMKKWAVGTERPDIRGFKTPDDYSGAARTVYSSLSRFWLTPENMKFASCGNTLMFDGGHMTVKTEILGYENGGRPKNPHNESFAAWFTKHYPEIAEKYPIYQELSDYGKLVALARYLKESGIPLMWFLMANKDLVLTEDSPGTVDNLSKKSTYWTGSTLQGGVEMKMNKGQFVYDATAVQAIAAARAQASRYDKQTTSMGGSKPVVSAEPFVFGLGTNRFTVTPQHSLTCGKDRRGIRYQTDLCLRAEGYKVTEEMVELIQSELLRRELVKLLDPIMDTLKKADEAKAEQTLAEYRTKAARTVEPLQNRVAGLKGKTFTTEQECGAAWDATVGAEADAGLRALFVMRSHYASNLEVVRYFNPAYAGKTAFGKGWNLMVPYGIQPDGKSKVAFRGLSLPRRMSVLNKMTGDSEVFEFSADRYSMAGYVPVQTNSTQWVGLFLLTDASFRLVDKVGSEFAFDGAGRLTEMQLSEDHQMTFKYQDEGVVAFKKMPYLMEEIEEAGKADFRGHPLSKRVSVMNLVSKKAETFAFNPDGAIVGYVPELGEKSAYRFMAVLSDGSYRLEDRNANQIDFSEEGIFRRFVYGETEPLVKSIASGRSVVSFSYTLGGEGRALVSEARLSANGDRKNVGVRYVYDEDERLCDVKPVDEDKKVVVQGCGGSARVAVLENR